MFGSILGGAARIITCPLDVANAVADVVFDNGDGSKESRMREGILADAEKLRDVAVTTLEELNSIVKPKQ